MIYQDLADCCQYRHPYHSVLVPWISFMTLVLHSLQVSLMNNCYDLSSSQTSFRFHSCGVTLYCLHWHLPWDNSTNILNSSFGWVIVAWWIFSNLEYLWCICPFWTQYGHFRSIIWTFITQNELWRILSHKPYTYNQNNVLWWHKTYI